jgi:hypothetical protein
MPPYLRRRFRGWGWFSTREIRYLPWRERERLTQEAWEAVHHSPRYRLMICLQTLLSFLAVGLLALKLGFSLLTDFLLVLTFLIQMVAVFVWIIWVGRLNRNALRQTLLNAGIRPAFCFECGYDLEGYEDNACPACDAPLLRQADSSPESS